MSRILAITGVGGYLGQSLVSYLHSQPEQLFDEYIGLDIRKLPPSNKVPITYYQKDVREPIAGILQEHGVTDLLHMAWVVNPVHDVKKAYDIDINGTKNVLSESLDAGISYLLHTSSTLSYGAHEDNPYPLRESDLLRGNENFHYPFHKMLVEEELDKFEEENPGKLRIGRIRPSAILSSELRNYITEILSGGWRTFFLLPYPTKETPIQFLHLNDALQGFTIMLKQRLEGSFNVSPDEDVLVGDIPKILQGRGLRIPLSILKPLLWIQWKLRISQAPPSYLDFVAFPFVASNEKIKRYGFVPKYTTKEAFQSLRD